ncbi:MAG TPA: M13 family metallopeptidase [Thermoanaerobaculia bacterium]|nr:M13 family metallopeptidase [Thermoanaerobaculia bacterium]
MSVSKIAAGALALSLAAVLMAADSPDAGSQQAAQQTQAPFDRTDLDATAKACVDFNQYANGGWVKKNPIPAAYPAGGATYQLLDRNREQLRTILESAAKNRSAAPGSNEQKIGDYYASCMDEAAIEAAGLKPLDPELDRIKAIKDVASLQQEIARLHKLGFYTLFLFGSEQDRKNSTEVIASAAQGGMGMPEPEYYSKNDPKSKDIREAYKAYVQKIFELSGDDHATAVAEANAQLALETMLASAAMNRTDRRNPDRTYHRKTLEQASKETPVFDWALYYKAMGVAASADVNVNTPDFFKEVDKDLSAVALADWKNLLRYSLIAAMTPALPKAYVDANFAFYSTKLRGTTEQLPRWKRCVAATDGALGEALGQVYVKTAFPPEAKARMVAMVNNLAAALHSDIDGLDWMSDTTKKAALAKLQAINRKIGYPDKWQDYTKLKVDRGVYAWNSMRTRAFDLDHDINKIGKPVDRGEWDMTPPTVNAYYNPSLNEIVFPAGILQPPFFDPNRDDAYNYGATGATIGHELTHGFDNNGAKFDANGNQVNWWTDADLVNFKARAKCIATQFDELVVGDVHENGELVSGESIADLAGLKIAYAAYMKSQEGKPARIIDGFTPQQRLFLGFAHGWAGSMRPEFERLLATSNEHPLDRFRVNETLSNMPEFATAFGCKIGDAMVRAEEKRCVVW